MRRSRLKTYSALLMCVFGAVVGLTSCTRTEHSDSHAPTVGDFCNPLFNYFKTDFPIDNVQLSYGGSLSQTVNDLKGNAVCSYAGDLSNPLRGASWLAPAQNGEDPSARINILKEKGYKLLPGHSAEIWVQDSREKRPDTTKGVVHLATETSRWQGELEILNETGSLAITDAQIGQAADLLIKTTEAMNK
ncbi:hypothetical protein VMT65_29100 [Nocardia sp. CDC153]|uniref:hypothetical protein n=1 Tax=Nocardia sp. CDC153 TaxID=3112167 RepID=UPI002DB72460|nr:hypothetical protein [Nocardia sp. CDC153]MEC3957124.1 hypothetical protein [Nocardia sp. CDC153]